MADIHADQALQGTNDDATLSKCSCVQLGYWNDPFVALFVPRPERRPPIINRGYYVRWAAIRKLTLQFLAAGAQPGQPPPPKQARRSSPTRRCALTRSQVLSLGAGFDTAFFSLAAAGLAPEKFAEVDFPEVTRRKAGIIARQEALRGMLGDSACVDAAAGTVASARYALQPADLRHPAQVAAAVSAAGLDPAKPTLVLLECVMVYLEPENGEELLRWAAAAFPTSCVISYDPTRPDDAFGKQMMLNLRARGTPFRGISAAATPAAAAARLVRAGWERASGADMAAVCSGLLDQQELRAAERVERLDELEEWVLFQRHYAMALGVSEGGAHGLFQAMQLPQRADADRPS